MQALLGGEEIYHYHSKLMMKDPKTGGSHIWHQDYGYWYNNACLFPVDMGSVFLPVDKCTKQNSCLQVLQSSHLMGRIDHILDGDQAGADPKRLSEAFKIFKLIHVEMDAGDGLFFHSNLLHSSEQNHSDLRRWVMISGYNTRRNNPLYKHHCPCYHPLQILPNSAITSCSLMESTVDKGFMDPDTDESATILKA
jgi:ectoine hydroxylase-related dioxygenase (phytanoyl-CoA dioxygenase family)